MGWYTEPERKGTSIGTMDGEAFYWGTEKEDKDGRWSQDWAIRDGFWVIHETPYHYIYKVRGNNRKLEDGIPGLPELF
jgi:hypothetical protein